MKFLADENVEKSIVDFLRSRAHDVIYVAELFPSISDEELTSLANSEQRILVTNNKDFGQLAFLQKKVATGVLLIRSSTERASAKVKLISQALKQYAEKLPNHFIVVSEAGVRIRKLMLSKERE